MLPLCDHQARHVVNPCHWVVLEDLRVIVIDVKLEIFIVWVGDHVLVYVFGAFLPWHGVDHVLAHRLGARSGWRLIRVQLIVVLSDVVVLGDEVRPREAFLQVISRGQVFILSIWYVSSLWGRFDVGYYRSFFLKTALIWGKRWYWALVHLNNYCLWCRYARVTT